MKKKIIFWAALSVLALGAVFGGTMAAYQAETNTEKTISTSSVDIRLNIEGTAVDDQGNVLYNSSDLKDGVVTGRVSATNAGNKAVYLRIQITKAWYRGEEKIFEAGGRDVDSRTIEAHLINPEDWLVPEDFEDQNHENIYIYYKKVLNAGETTSEVMDSFSLLKNADGNTNQYAGLSARMRFDANSIQTVAAKDAMLAEWGVIAAFDADGRIVSIVNQ